MPAFARFTYIFSAIFKAQSNEQISRLYQDFGCQHHLVQDQSTNAPTIPALTPVGFAHWMTIFLLAYPDAESKRLAKVVLALPIDADGQMVDGKAERLPKQISRHLLPEKEDRKSKKLVEDAIANFYDDLGSTSRRKPGISPPPLARNSSVSQSRPRPVEIHQLKTSPTISSAPPLERERKPYTGAPSTASETSSNEDSVKIERDRQPYTAQPGSGKVYTEASSMKTGSRSNRATSTTRTSRTRSPIDSEPRHQRTSSTASQTYAPPPRAAGRRTSSPPLKKYSDSVPVDIGGYKSGPPLSATSSNFSQSSQHFGPSSYGPSTTTIPPPPPPVDIRDSRDKRARDERQYRRGTDEGILGAEFSSPRDAERWDRFQESRASETDRPDRSYEARPSVGTDPRDLRGAAYEDWYREPPSTRTAYDGDRRY
jgi:hypothetical protein